MFDPNRSRWLVGLLAATLGLTACTAKVATAPAADHPQVASVKPSSAPAPAPTTAHGTTDLTPAPLPSLSLLLEGVVDVDAELLLSKGYAEHVGPGIRLISEHGAGQISDAGVGLLSNNGSGLVSNNSGTLVSNNSAGVVGKFQLLSDDAHALVPVQGMVVTAYGLRDGKVLAGPIATDARGHYRLGFLQAPGANLRVVAAVRDLASDPAFAYDAYVPAKAASLVTGDDSRALSQYLLKVLVGRLQLSIDDRIAGNPLKLGDSHLDPTANQLTGQMAALLNQKSQAEAVAIDKDGGVHGDFARHFAERTLAFADLESAEFKDLAGAIADIRAFTAGLAARPSPPLFDQLLALASDGPKSGQILPLLIKYGMPTEQAQSLFHRLDSDTLAISNATAQNALAHADEAIVPILAKLGVGSLADLAASAAAH